MWTSLARYKVTGYRCHISISRLRMNGSAQMARLKFSRVYGTVQQPDVIASINALILVLVSLSHGAIRCYQMWYAIQTSLMLAVQQLMHTMPSIKTSFMGSGSVEHQVANPS